MKNYKYLLAGFSCAALMAVAPLMQKDAMVANAATVEDVDFSTQSMQVKSEDDSLIYVSFPKVKNDSYKEAKWTTYTTTGGAINVDLSSQNVTKDFYVEVKGNKDKTSKLYHFSPTEKVKADKVDNVNATVKLIDKNKAQVKSDVEFATANGQWIPYAFCDENGVVTPEADLSVYQENGATLRFRTMATESAEPKEASKKVEKVLGKDKKEAIATYDVVGNFASNEVKVKIGKRPSGPKIAVDYKNQQITIKVGQKSGFYQLYKGVEAQKEQKIGTEAIKPDLTADGAVIAWLDADTAKNKARSAYTEVAYDGVKALTNTQEVEDMVGVTYAAITAKGDAADKKVTVKLTEGTGKNAGKYDVEISNASGLTFEYVVSKDAPTATTKYATVKAGAKKTVKKQEADVHVYVRLAADAKNKVWSSATIDMGTLVGKPGTPAKETEGTGTTTPGGTTEPTKPEVPISAELDSSSARNKLVLTLPEGVTIKSATTESKDTDDRALTLTVSGNVVDLSANIKNGGVIDIVLTNGTKEETYTATYNVDKNWAVAKKA